MSVDRLAWKSPLGLRWLLLLALSPLGCALFFPPDGDEPCAPELTKGTVLHVRVLQRYDEDTTAIEPPDVPYPAERSCGALLALGAGDEIQLEITGTYPSPLEPKDCRRPVAAVSAMSIGGQEVELEPMPDYAQVAGHMLGILATTGMAVGPDCVGGAGLILPLDDEYAPILELSFFTQDPPSCGLPEGFAGACVDQYVMEFVDASAEE
jgi:hypothetical protein